MTATILITGAGRGIGLELARQAEKQGLWVIPLARSVCEPLPGRAFEAVDVTSARSLAEVARQLEGTPVDILINNAGIIGPERQSTLDTDFEGFRRTLEVNTLAPLLVTQTFLPNLRLARDAKGSARVVMISSRMGSMSYAKSDQIAYRASKAALNKVTQGLATDLAGESIFVRSVHPGWVRTDMGGAAADVEVADSAAGVLARAFELDRARTGTFVNHDGSTLAW